MNKPKDQGPAADDDPMAPIPMTGGDKDAPNTVSANKQVIFVPPPASTVNRGTIKPIRLSQLKSRPPSTPYVKRKGVRQQTRQESPTPSSSSSNPNPFAILDHAWNRRLKAEPTLCPTVCPTCLQPMPANEQPKRQAKASSNQVEHVVESMSSGLNITPNVD
ncbi:hypothetical protein MD484_g5014, partial [Candolleomyces efflorescens]